MPLQLKFKFYLLLPLLPLILISCQQSNSGSNEIELVWNVVEVPEEYPMLVSATPDGSLFAVNAVSRSTSINADRSLFYRSIDGGATWQGYRLHELPITFNGQSFIKSSSLVYYIKSVGINRLLMVASISRGTTPKLLYSDNNGDSWEIVRERYNDMFWILINTDWMGNVTYVGRESVNPYFFMSSNDYGRNWSYHPVDFNGQPFISPAVNGEDNSFFGASPYGLNITRNGGQSWELQDENATYITKSGDGVLAALFLEGDDYTVNFSFDNGITWNQADDSKISRILHLVGLSDSRFVMVTFSGLLYLTDDYGDSWQPIVNSSSNENINITNILSTNLSVEIFEANNGKLYISNLHQQRSRSGQSIDYLLVADLPSQ